MATNGIFNMEKYEELELAYAHFTNSHYCIAVNSGTSALHLGLVALGIGRGDEVIIPDFTMAACGFATAYTGAKVITVDCKDNLTIDENLIEKKITEKTKAIMPVHIYGRLCNMAEINKIAKKYGLYVIEDACESQGAKGLGNADLTCYSFYKNKIIAAQEGGAITTKSKAIYNKCQYLKNMAFGDKHDYYHKAIGFNYRMPDKMAEMALKSLANYNRTSRRRREIEKLFNNLVPIEFQMPKREAVWVYDWKLPYNNKIPECRHFFKPLSSMPMFKQKIGPKSDYYSKFSYINITNLTNKRIKTIWTLMRQHIIWG
jgi:dTDP-4-amino-4,6-dideoxygalactose transaminase